MDVKEYDWVPSWIKDHIDSGNDTKLESLPDPLNLQPIVREQFKRREFIRVCFKNDLVL